MQFKSEKNEHTRQILQNSRQSFDFDKDGIKNRLITSIQHGTLTSHGIVFSYSPVRWNVALGTCLTLVFVCAGTFAYADGSKPGDKLYFMDQLGEDITLKMPRPLEVQTKLRARIVSERVQELEQLPAKDTDRTRIQAVSNSRQSLIDAINQATDAKLNLRTRGKIQSSQNVDDILQQLDKMGERQEQEVENFQGYASDQGIQLQLRDNLEAIKKARLKAHSEAGREIQLEIKAAPNGN